MINFPDFGCIITIMKKLPLSLAVVLSLSIFLLLGAADSCPPQEQAKPASTETQAGPGKALQNRRARKIEPGQKFRTDGQDEVLRFWRDPELVKELKLQPDQIESFDVLMGKYLKNLNQARMGVRKAYQKLIVALSQKVVDEKTVAVAERQFREAGSKRHRVMTGRLVAFRGILDHDQWLELRRLRPRAFQIDRFRPAIASGAARAFIPGPEKAEGSPGVEGPSN